MGHSYASTAKPGMYLTINPSKLLPGDIIWVIEGRNSTPTEFALVDCFTFTDPEHPPFPPKYEKFTLRVSGRSFLLSAPVALSKSSAWFSELHARFITKQRFFNSLAAEPDIVKGLSDASGVKL